MVHGSWLKAHGSWPEAAPALGTQRRASGRRGGVAPTSGGFCGDGSLSGLWVCALILRIFGVICRVHFKRGSLLGVWRSVGALCGGIVVLRYGSV
jgi:hypothetical protein